MPPNTVYVGRGSIYGNPFVVGNELTPDATVACAYYEMWLNGRHFMQIGASGYDGAVIHEQAVLKLRGKNLACWCSLDQPCHADILLRIANG